jgi:hypothetical protein
LLFPIEDFDLRDLGVTPSGRLLPAASPFDPSDLGATFFWSPSDGSLALDLRDLGVTPSNLLPAAYTFVLRNLALHPLAFRHV